MKAVFCVPNQRLGVKQCARMRIPISRNSRTGSVNCENIRHSIMTHNHRHSISYTIDANLNSLDILQRRLHQQN